MCVFSDCALYVSVSVSDTGFAYAASTGIAYAANLAAVKSVLAKRVHVRHVAEPEAERESRERERDRVSVCV
eukprot:398396-Rhodomonas_salina.1